ncbi:UNVERIFIED_CONTAM: putative galacturonosyltransferase-like 4 [Sesamum radiatum]|uniref:Hexosyltransferase n=1 Tax=Sesamum radiatum TaxID=300843 RepID=A0AAW2UBV8_SESRA
MALWSSSSSSLLPLLGLLSLILLHPTTTTTSAIRLNIIQNPTVSAAIIPSFREAPAFRNGHTCTQHHDHKNIIHIVMPLDVNYIRGTMAAVLSILQHSTCPEDVSFHFLSVHLHPEISSLIKSTFPYLTFKMYPFDPNRVRGKISKSIRQALDQGRADTHWSGTSYAFWSDVNLARTFEGRRPCYFNTGVMVVDVDQWRKGGYTQKVEEWMAVQKRMRIYHLGSLPPVLLVFAGNIKAVDHRWNQHGLGGTTWKAGVEGSILVQSASYIGVERVSHG